MNIKKLLYLMLIPVGISVLTTLAIYSSLPDLVPTHWNAAGQIDTLKPRWIGLFTAVLPVLVIFILSALPVIDPKSDNYTKHEKAYAVSSILILIFLTAIHWFTIFAAKGVLLHMDILVRVLIGILFLFLGYYLPQVRKNYTFGIRTPWTLDNEEVWKRTQRIGGKGFIACGVIIMLTIFLPSAAAFWIAAASVLLLAFAIFLYSYLQYKKLSD
jgi:uncharacterized membrane protein